MTAYLFDLFGCWCSGCVKCFAAVNMCCCMNIQLDNSTMHLWWQVGCVPKTHGLDVTLWGKWRLNKQVDWDSLVGGPWIQSTWEAKDDTCRLWQRRLVTKVLCKYSSILLDSIWVVKNGMLIFKGLQRLTLSFRLQYWECSWCFQTFIKISCIGKPTLYLAWELQIWFSHLRCRLLYVANRYCSPSTTYVCKGF